MSSMTASVQEFVAMQPKFTWRRRIMRGLINVVFNLIFRLEITGLENIPASGSSLLMMNHITLLDPILCMGAVKQRFVIPMTKIENLENPLTAPFVRWWGSYSINRGEIDRKALMNSIELLKSGQLILIAPEGHRHPEGLSQPKDGFAYIATKADAVIIPAAISGAVGWQSAFRLKRPRIQVNFGRPFRFRLGENGRVQRDDLPVMMDEAMYQLAMAVQDETRRGVYSDLSKATTNHLEFV
ncbi:MAG: lysophospholipid acyltransferase family protein [Anaerolineae bacterium]